MFYTGLTRARRSQAAVALDPFRHQRFTLIYTKLQNLTSTTPQTRISQRHIQERGLHVRRFPDSGR
jgi:hypothetical protein